MAVEFITAVDDGLGRERGDAERFQDVAALRLLQLTSFTDEEPMSSPSASLLLAMAVSPLSGLQRLVDASIGRDVAKNFHDHDLPRAAASRRCGGGRVFRFLDAETERDEILRLVSIRQSWPASIRSTVDSETAGLRASSAFASTLLPELLNSIHAAPPRAVIYPCFGIV